MPGMRRARRLGALFSTATTILVVFASGAAAAISTRTTTDLTGTVLTCPREPVVLSGTETVLATDTLASAGHRTIRFVFNLSGVTAVGQSSGSTFRVAGVTVSGSTFELGPVASASTSTFVRTWMLVPTSGGTPLSFHEVLTVIFSADGSLAAIASHGSPDCN